MNLAFLVLYLPWGIILGSVKKGVTSSIRRKRKRHSVSWSPILPKLKNDHLGEDSFFYCMLAVYSCQYNSFSVIFTVFFLRAF